MTAPDQIPAEIIEAAARAEWIVQCEQSQIFTASMGLPGAGVIPWEDVAEPIRERTRERIRPAVQAAWPLIAAHVLNEAAVSFAWAGDDEDYQTFASWLRTRALEAETPLAAQATEETTR